MDGVWSRDDGNARVRIAPCGDKTCATNVWIRDTSKGEAPGDQLIMSLKRSSDTEFSGTAYDPKRGMTYSSRRHGREPDHEDKRMRAGSPPVQDGRLDGRPMSVFSWSVLLTGVIRPEWTLGRGMARRPEFFAFWTPMSQD